MHNYFGTKRESIKLDQLGSPAAGGVSRMWDLFFFEKSCQAHLVLIFISGEQSLIFFYVFCIRGGKIRQGKLVPGRGRIISKSLIKLSAETWWTPSKRYLKGTASCAVFFFATGSPVALSKGRCL